MNRQKALLILTIITEQNLIMNDYISDHFWTKDEDTAYLKDFADENVYLEMPLVNLIYRMLDMAADGLPLTKVGNPTIAVIEELYPLGPKDYYWENFPRKKMTLSAIPQMAIIWDYLKYANLFRKYKGTLRLTRLGKEMKGHPKRLAHYLFYYTQEMANTSLMDSCEFKSFNNALNQVAVLLDTYGNEFRSVEFYAAKYSEVEADFAFFYEISDALYFNLAVSCFNIRIMERFFNWMGFVEMIRSHYDKEQKKYILEQYKISPLFRKLIGINRPERKEVIPIWINNPSMMN